MTEIEQFCGWVRMAIGTQKNDINGDAAEKLVKMVVVLSGVLEEFQPIIERMQSDGRLKDANTFMFKERAKYALSKANEIARGGWRI